MDAADDHRRDPARHEHRQLAADRGGHPRGDGLQVVSGFSRTGPPEGGHYNPLVSFRSSASVSPSRIVNDWPARRRSPWYSGSNWRPCSIDVTAVTTY